MIVTEGLTKQYGAVMALSDLSMTVEKGEVFGLLGPNGSGKTTTIRLLLGLLRPTRGRASVAGYDCWKKSLDVRERVSYIPGELRMFGWMSGLGMLRFLSELRGSDALDRAVAIAERVLKLDLNRKVRTYSTGMKQKLALAQTFADPVEILILDEPTSALDPSARSDILSLIREARDVHRQTVIFSGHVLSEVEEVADRVAIMRLGRLMHTENMHQRRTNLRLVLARFEREPPARIPEELDLTVRECRDDVLLMEHRGPVAPLLNWLAAQNVADVAIGTEDLRSLYDQFHGSNALKEEWVE